MLLLIVFAFIAGIITILSPCILPVLPIILSTTAGDGKSRPLGVVTGFIASFTFFTLFLSSIVQATGIPADSLRLVSILILAIFGLTLILPKAQLMIEQIFARLSRFTPNTASKTGFRGGIIVGLSLGLLWTPCVGPILASVISLAITGTVTTTAIFITLAYSVGTAIPMFAIMYGGQSLLQKNRWILNNSSKIQKIFGVLMILTAIGIAFNVDRKFQTYILQKFPNYGTGLTKIEENSSIQQELDKIRSGGIDKSDMGKPMFDLLNQSGPIAPELKIGGQWFNSAPLQLNELRGKVVVVDFWTYSCINCQRTLPYLKSWYEKYKDDGLVIIGVHSPEFEFEKSAKNLEQAISDFGIKYPVMQDNDFATWRAYDNHYWPAKYFLDKDGHVRWTHFGEGQYDESEKVIQELLAETGKNVNQTIDNPSYTVYANTPETYLGYSRMARSLTNEQIVPDKAYLYSAPNAIRNNYFALGGVWTIGPEYSMPLKSAYLKFAFDAKEVYLVMRPKDPKTSAKVKVSLDEKQDNLGDDVKNGIVTLDKDRLYKLINLPAPGQHLLKLEFLDDNVEVYAFTFG